MSAPPAGKRVVLIGWSGADWALAEPFLAAGWMPNLAALRREGASGSLRGFAPFDPGMSWMTAATGCHPDEHGVIPGGSVACQRPPLWRTLSALGRPTAVLGWPGVRVADEAAHSAAATGVSEYFARGAAPSASVWPAARADELATALVPPAEIDPALLGLFIPRLAELDLKRDPRPTRLLHHLAELYSLHNASIALALNDRPALLAVCFPFLRRICDEFLPYHLSRDTAAHGSAAALYGEVVIGAYRLVDVLLGDLLRHFEADATVMLISDHGYALQLRSHRSKSVAR
ncbi:MAG: alkaline phosphatase family protein, partial [Verrucomicrobiota bacterium]